MLADDESQHEPRLSSTANYQHSEHVIIADDESRPKTQRRDIVDADDGTIESLFTNC